MKATTNPIAGDTCNLSINVLQPQRAILGRAAHAEDKSMGQYLREVIELGLRAKNNALASQWNTAKVQRFCHGANLMFFGSLVVWQVLLGDIDARRTPNRLARIVRTIKTARRAE